MKTELHLNNSGGDYWIDLDDLIAADERWSRDSTYSLVFDGDEYDARESFKLITGYDGDESGCECCGPPFCWTQRE